MAITCTGAWLECATNLGVYNCKTVWAVRPRAPLVCFIKQACMIGNTLYSNVLSILFDEIFLLEEPGKLAVFDTSLETKAFEGHKICIDSISENAVTDCGNSIAIETFPSSEWNKTLRSSSNYDTAHISTVVIHRNGNLNVGHVLGDEIWPIFETLMYYNVDLHNFQVAATLHERVARDPGPEYLFDYFTNYPVLKFDGRKSYCFENLYAGASGLSYSYGNPNPALLSKYRDFLVEKLNISSSPFRFSNATTVLRK